VRFIYFLVLLIILAGVAVFAVQNNEEVGLRFLQWNAPLPMAALVGAAYALGMLSGWTVVGFLRRSFDRAMQRLNR
jgi:putative membrane protein